MKNEKESVKVEQTEEIKDQEVQNEETSQEDRVEALKNNKEMMAKVSRTCDLISNKFNDNWFSKGQLGKFLKIDENEVYDLLMTLNIFGFVIERSQGKDLKYKITRTKEQKLQALRYAREVAQADLREIEAELTKMESDGD